MSEDISVRVLEHAGAWISSAWKNVTKQTTLDAGRAAAGVEGYRNRLLNSAFQINQRAPATNADDTYCFDRFYVLTQTGTIAVSALTDPESGRPTGIRLTQSQASAQRMGLAQIVESADIRDLRGKAVAMAARIRCSSSQAIRMAILEWTGTADTVTSDVVNDWTNATFTTGNFFISTTTNLIATGSTTPSAATWTDMTQIAGNFGAALNNAIVMVWTEAVAAQNVTLDIDEIGLCEGARAGPFQRRAFADELALCQRYYEKSFPLATTPAQNVGSAVGALVFNAITAGATTQRAFLTYKVPKRVAVTPTLYNHAAANAQVRDNNAGADCSASSVTAGFSGADSFAISCTGNAGTAIGNGLVVHWTADAEL